MEIVEKNFKDGAREYKFDNGAWVKLDIDGEYGSWEYQEDEDDEETYMEGGIWFDGKQIEDYDGCFELPEEVKIALKDLGFTMDD